MARELQVEPTLPSTAVLEAEEAPEAPDSNPEERA
jgi:hypothetical protein